MKRKTLVTHADPKSPAAEAFRMLRTNIEYIGVDRKKQLIQVTSPLEKEGKTTTVCNLAVALANGGARVLLVDCDLRRPWVYKVMDLRKQPGITNLLAQDQDWREVVQEDTGIENLHVITGGPVPPLAAELLASRKMGALLEEFREAYDYVLMDSPPLLSVTDAGVLATRVDGTVICVAQGQTSVEAARAAKRSLERVNASILGCVITKADTSGKDYYPYHYYRYSYSKPRKEAKGLLGRLQALRHRI